MATIDNQIVFHSKQGLVLSAGFSCFFHRFINLVSSLNKLVETVLGVAVIVILPSTVHYSARGADLPATAF